MKKIFFIAVTLFLVALPVLAGTIDPLNKNDMAAPTNLTTKTGVENLIKAGVRWVYTIFFIIAVFFILIAAYNFVSGGGNDAKIKLAKSQIRYAVIAIVVALVSTAVSLIINSSLQLR